MGIPVSEAQKNGIGLQVKLAVITGMPLLHGKDFVIDRTVSPDLKPDLEIWRCRATGEVFLDYTDLLERQSLCRSREFSSGYTGKSGLNFEEAKREDDSAKLALAKVRRLPDRNSYFRACENLALL